MTAKKALEKSDTTNTAKPVEPPSDSPTRRWFVAGLLGALPAAKLITACAGGDDDDSSGTGQLSDDDDATDDDASFDDDDTTIDCTLYPQQTAGPFYLDLDLVRRDVTEGKAGTALVLTVTVVRASDCSPIKDAAVDIWHCDAGGLYSGYPGQLGGVDTTGETFLRGTQITDDAGIARFDSIYPGWYPGRTTHIHFKVHLSSNLEATSQMYFPEDVTTAVYGTAPYDARGQKDTANTADGIAGDPPPPLLNVSKDGSSYQAGLTVGVADPS